MSLKFSSADALTKEQVEEIKSDWKDHIEWESPVSSVSYLELAILKAMGNKFALDKGENIMNIVLKNLKGQFPHPQDYSFEWDHILPFVEETLYSNNPVSWTFLSEKAFNNYKKIIKAVKKDIEVGKFHDYSYEATHNDYLNYNVILVKNHYDMSKDALNANVAELCYRLGEINGQKGINCHNFIILDDRNGDVAAKIAKSVFAQVMITQTGMVGLYVNNRKDLIEFGLNNLKPYNWS